MNIVFAGTPAFGLPCLEALQASSHSLIAIYTQPDRPAGRGRKLQASAVKEWALAQPIPVYQPFNFKQEETIEALAALKPDLMVVIAYGLILPKKVLEIPRLGCVNVHASLLPRWRGASPIQHALLEGDEISGITVMQMDAGMDTGDKLMEVSCRLSLDDTAASLHDKLADLAPSALLETIEVLATAKQKPVVQDNALATYAGKIKKEDAAINWARTARELANQIRAFNPWPVAFTQTDTSLLRIYQAEELVGDARNFSPGTIVTLDLQGMVVATGAGFLRITKVQFPGAKAMSIADWLHAGRKQLEVAMVLR